jgi:2-aminobenzoate-CoA ligase
MERSAHADTFAREHLPPEADWPKLDFTGAPELAHPPRLNCATELLDKTAARFPDRVALRFEGRELTYREVLSRANRLAHVLADDLGVVPGKRVLLRSPNNPGMVIAWFAVLKVGAIAVATMPLLRERELRYIAEKARCELSLCDDKLAGDLSWHRAVTFTELEERGVTKSDSFANVDTAADDVALIAFTSGTTGAAKGAMHFHRDVMAAADLFPTYALEPTPDDVFFGTPPIAFTFGLGALVLFPFRFGASTLLIEKPSPDAIVEAMRTGTILFTAPTMFRVLTELVKKAGKGALAKCVSAGETLRLGTFEAWREATGIKIIDGLGSTEMLHIFICAAGDAIRPGATGKVLRGYEARVVDERGDPALPGTVGRLFVRGPTGCRYLADPERQRVYAQNGWNFTGDAYRVDEDGYFWFVARADDMIISAGYNISGPEVEAVLLEHPKVKECAVVGAPDGERGFIVKAFVVLRDMAHAVEETVRELQDHVKKSIAPYKYPRAIAFVDALPKTENGKIQRYKLRLADSGRIAG